MIENSKDCSFPKPNLSSPSQQWSQMVENKTLSLLGLKVSLDLRSREISQAGKFQLKQSQLSKITSDGRHAYKANCRVRRSLPSEQASRSFLIYGYPIQCFLLSSLYLLHFFDYFLSCPSWDGNGDYSFLPCRNLMGIWRPFQCFRITASKWTQVLQLRPHSCWRGQQENLRGLAG